MKWLLEQWHFWFVLVCVVGAFRNAYFHLAYEPLRAAPSPRIGSEFEPLRPLLVGSERIGYVTDEPLDADPALPREHGLADMRYAHAQYALAPVILAYADQSSALVLANFEHADALDRYLSTAAFTVIFRIAPATALLRRR